MGDLSDIEIVDRLLRGVPGADVLFHRKYEKLIYHCIRKRADAADVDDIFQSFFERLLETNYHILRVWRRGSSLPIYLSKVIRNFVIDFQRKKPWRELLVPDPPEGPDRGETPETTLLLKELRRAQLEAWATLDGRDKQLVCCKLHRHLTNEAMARRFNLTSGALRTALSRALGRLLASLRNAGPEFFSP